MIRNSSKKTLRKLFNIRRFIFFPLTFLLIISIYRNFKYTSHEKIVSNLSKKTATYQKLSIEKFDVINFYPTKKKNISKTPNLDYASKIPKFQYKKSSHKNISKTSHQFLKSYIFVPNDTWGKNWNWENFQTWKSKGQHSGFGVQDSNYYKWKEKIHHVFRLKEEKKDIDFLNNTNDTIPYNFFLKFFVYTQKFVKRNALEAYQKYLFLKKLSNKSIYNFYIPGSVITTYDKVKRVKSALTCLATNGEWVFNNTPRQIPWDLHPPIKTSDKDYRTCDFLWMKKGGLYGARAENSKGNQTRWNVRSPLKYEWKSTSEFCNFRKFDRAKFCAAVGRRNILLVGDSMQLQFHNAILNHVVTNETARSAGVMGDARYPCMGHDLCDDVLGGRGFHLRVRRNDKLTIGSGDRYNSMQWIDLIKKFRIEILIINRGAHFRENNAVLKDMRIVLNLLRKHYPNLLILWRNTPHGHPNCFTKKYQKPLKKRMKLKELKSFFNYDKFRLQNELLKPLMEEFGVVYMDVDHATSLRSDGHFQKFEGHRDCLHYCSPGPVDFWVHLLYNILVELNS